MNLVRAAIILVMGLIMIVFPDGVYRFQVYMIEKLGINYNVDKEREYYFHVGLVLIIFGLVLARF